MMLPYRVSKVPSDSITTLPDRVVEFSHNSTNSINILVIAIKKIILPPVARDSVFTMYSPREHVKLFEGLNGKMVK
ncbi:hypothetical protein C494_20148 [Natronorubrum bangense JCM 10635]|uniref:Uncharacterized protein n=1 Tax=Natronorubrum bangense JCM 10635 TaxID=1227500 RepID=L9W007_9EURY|nr:hypothetical protein C494_20148 [Natronorubrum bangense JCM 10635]